jgi:hypothetical protein
MISRSDLACAGWQKITATNWLQQLKPLAPRSALCSTKLGGVGVSARGRIGEMRRL